MKSSIRKIGNSRGVLIPATFLAACKIVDEIELHLEGDRIIIEPVHAPRAGWFANFQSESDEDLWSDIKEIEKENEDWQW